MGIKMIIGTHLSYAVSFKVEDVLYGRSASGFVEYVCGMTITLVRLFLLQGLMCLFRERIRKTDSGNQYPIKVEVVKGETSNVTEKWSQLDWGKRR